MNAVALLWLRMKPPGKPCLVSVSIIGLRNITLDLSNDPVLEVVVPSVKADPSKPQPKAAAKSHWFRGMHIAMKPRRGQGRER